jgi:hypothetical protein
MKRRAELELQARVEAVGTASLEHSLWIAPVAHAHHAEIGGLGLIRAVGMTLKANLVFVVALEYVRIACGVPFYAQQRPVHQGRLRRCAVGKVGFMAVYARGVAGRATRGFWKRVQRGSRTL